MVSIISIVLLLFRDWRVTPALLLLIQLALPTLGFQLLQEQHGEVITGWVVLAAPLFVAFGMVLWPKNQIRRDAEGVPFDMAAFLRHSIVVLTVLAVVHFAIGGIPAFSSSLETERFNLGGSGLGGFPSRAVMYAIPALALISLATVTDRTKRITVIIWGIFIISRLAMGFKGGLLEVIFLGFIAYLIRVGRPKARHLMLFFAGLSLALVYVEVVRSQYATSAGGASALDYILHRSTTQAIESGYMALWYSPSVGLGEPVFWYDLKQLLLRYLGLAGSGDFTFDMLISSIITGTPLGLGMFVVPVTVGGAVYLLFSMSIPFVVAVLVSLGFAWNWAVHAIANKKSVVICIIAAVALIGIRMFLLNGNGAYLIINLTFTIAMLSACALPTSLAGRTVRQRQRFLSEPVLKDSDADG